MKVAVIGYGIEGRSAVNYWLKKGAEVTVCKRTEVNGLPEGVRLRFGEGYLKGLDEFDVISRTGSVHPDLILAANTGVEHKITTVINEFFRSSPTKNIIGVTGTKGKGTTSTLIYRMLKTAGKHAYLAGNIGSSPLDFIDELTPDSWVVLELSSYQLYDLKQSPHIGVCLTVVPEHLNWHGTMDDYVRSKMQLFTHQTEKDIAIYFADSQTSHDVASTSPGAKIPYYAVPGAYIEDEKYLTIDDQRVCEVNEIKMVGRHNWQNACAAVTAFWQVMREIEPPRSVLLSFAGLPHRIEFVREVNDIRYFNDSFAANPSATEAAIEAVTGPKVLVLGGFDRMLPLDHFVQFIKAHERELAGVLLVGQSATRLADELEAADFASFKKSDATTMSQIVAEASQLAKGGESVLFSPGFPSFDMFKNFEDRGEQFKREVESL
jgi:UDP-N-acetylmuramoylalanine--D-glutamate ligase